MSSRRTSPSIRRRGKRQNERGVVLVISAITLVMLLLFSAMAVDLGLAMTARRADQNAADAAVIAGVPERHNETALAATVLASLNSNLRNSPFTLADLNAPECALEPLPGATWARYPTYDCLAHNQAYTEIWLRVPTQEIDTVFAGIGGIETIEHSAFAQAGDRIRSNNVLPYALTTTGAAGNYDCLKAGAGNVPDANCSGSASGNFGRVVFGLWGNDDLGTTQDCTGTKMYEINLAQGLDHDLSRFNQSPNFGTTVIDTDSCGTVPAPNSMRTDTGNVPQDTYDGLLGPTIYPDGGPSRLHRNTGLQSYFTTTDVNSEIVDDTPIWEFIDPGLAVGDDVPRSCWADNFALGFGRTWLPADVDVASPDVQSYFAGASISAEDRMIKLVRRCLTHFTGQPWDDNGGLSPADPLVGCTGACTDPIFGRNSGIEPEEQFDIQTSPRFGYVPVITAFPSGTSTPVNIIRFKAVFLQRAYGGNCNTSTCEFIFDPGFSAVHTGVSKVNALTAFVFPDASLPDGLGDEDAPNSYGKVKFVRLTR